MGWLKGMLGLALALSCVGCGAEREWGGALSAQSGGEKKPQQGLSLVSGTTSLGEQAMWEGEMGQDGDVFALDGSYTFTVDAVKDVTLRKLYGAAACGGESVKIAAPRFEMRGGGPAGEEASGTFAVGSDAHPLGKLEPGEYTLRFRVEASSPCSVAVAFVSEA